VLLSVAMILWPSIFTVFIVMYYRAVLKMFGYKIELTPIAPNEPEKVMKRWGVLSIVFFLLLLLMFYFMTNR
jgi:hypothetical protein